jgi:hypothetical protein
MDNNNELPELTPEQEEAIIAKRFGVSSDQLVKKEDQVVVLTEEEKKQKDEEKKQKVLTTGLENAWFKKEEYDEYQQLSSQNKIEIAKKQFIADNPELGEEAAAIYSQIFSTDEEDEVFELGSETGTPNVKKKVALKLAESIAENQIQQKFSKILNAEKEYDSLQIKKKNVADVEKAISEMPGSFEIKVGSDVYKYNITEDDKKEAKVLFGNDETLIGKEKVDPEEVKNNTLLFIKAKNLEGIIEEATIAALTKQKAAYERGEKGIIPTRGEKNVSTGKKDEFVKKHGLDK